MARKGSESDFGLDMTQYEIKSNKKLSEFSIILKKNMIKDGIKVVEPSNRYF